MSFPALVRRLSVVLGLPVLAVGLAVVLAACGDLSQEDLLFRAALPPRDAVALEVPGAVDDQSAGSATQGLSQGLSSCTDGDVRCNATELAEGFNKLTFTLLDTVDAITALPPSVREPGRRVWGPHFELEKNRTFRFEMVRNDAGTFAFCLHVAAGRVVDEDVADLTCASDDGAMLNVLSGEFAPSNIAGDGARQGEGTMHFEAEKLRGLDGGDRFGRVLDFGFDNTDGEVNIDVLVADAAFSARPRDALYTFSRLADGSGDFGFDVFTNLVDGGLIPQSEHVRLVAKWATDQSGRAIGVVDEGDVEDGQSFTIDQCWDAALTTTRYKDVSNAVVVGDEDTACTFTAEDVSALLQ